MNKKLTPGSVFFGLILFAVLGFILWRVVIYAAVPELIKSLVEFLMALGISGLLCFSALIIFSLISAKSYQDRRKIKIIGNNVRGLAYFQTIEKSSTNFDNVLTQPLGDLHSLDRIPIEIVMTNYGFQISLSQNIVTHTVSNQNTNHFFINGCTKIISPIGYVNYYYYTVVRNKDEILYVSKANEIGKTADNEEPILGNDEKLFIIIVIHAYMIVIHAYMKEETIDHYEALDKPEVVIITSTNGEGRGNNVELIALYQEIDKWTKISQSSDDDDSWMYKSRPYY